MIMMVKIIKKPLLHIFFDNLSNERMNEIKSSGNQVKYDDLTYYFNNKYLQKRFICFKASLGFYRNIRTGYTTLNNEKENESEFKDDLNVILRGKPQHNSEEQIRATENMKKLYETREKAIELSDYYSTIASEDKYEAQHGEGLKMLILKQILQRLSIALAQVLSGNTCENSLNKILYS